ncbi:hypothetical protein ACFSR6_21760 [Pedobacter vanadiisoli]|uniref:Universal stress protein family protein n=1 Tax=Pedobacter vanadiisoli TaxID=1761975 RepID=A0ABW5MRN5_9SPHI
MKKLIILTDFSKTANNAANIALEIAIKLHLDVQQRLPMLIFPANL